MVSAYVMVQVEGGEYLGWLKSVKEELEKVME